MANDPADTHLDSPAEKAAEAKESAPDKGLIQTLWEGIEAELKKAAAEKDGGESGADSLASSKGDSKIDAGDEKLYKSYFDATPDDEPKAVADGGSDSKPDKDSNSGRDRVDAEPARETAVALFTALNPVFTVETAIFAALEERSAEELKAIKDEFKKSFGVDLETRLSEELDGDDRKYALDLLNQRGEALVPIPPGSSRAELRAANETINGAFDGWYAVDREKVLEALAGKSPAELESMNALYKERFGRSLDEEFDEGFPPRTRSQWVELAAEWKAERDGLESAKKTVDRETMAELAGKIHDYEPDFLNSLKQEGFAVIGKNGFEPLEHPYYDMLEGKSDAERAVIKDLFKERYGVDLEDFLEKKVGGDRAIRMLNHRDRDFADLPADKQPEARKKAEVLVEALGRPFVDTGAVKRTLEKLDESERKVVAAYYEEYTGEALTDVLKERLEGSEEREFVSYVEYGSRDDAAVMYLNITKGDDAAVRTELRNLTSAQIGEIDRKFQERYGKSLYDAMMKEDDLSAQTKKSLEIYMKGADKRSEADWEQLIDIAMKAGVSADSPHAASYLASGHMEMFQEVMSSKSITPEFRARWLEDGGKEKLERAFVFGYDHAYDYARYGGLSLITKVSDNSGTFNDDEDGIDRAADEATDVERALYKRGLEIQREIDGRHADDIDFQMSQMFGGGVPITELAGYSQADIEAYSYFSRVNDTIWDPADDKDEFNSYVDRIVYKGGHGQAVRDIENMPRETWEALRSDPEKQKEYLAQFEHLSDGWRKRCQDLFARKMDLATFDEAEVAHKKSITNAMDQMRTGYMGGRLPFVDPESVYKAIEEMNPEDQKRYREDPRFKADVDRWATEFLNSENKRNAAYGLLDKVARGQPPEPDFVDLIFREGGKDETDESRVVRLLENAFKDSESRGEAPTLRERINNPETEEDRLLSRRVNAALRGALDADELENYARPLLEKGRLTLDEKMTIHRAEETGAKAVFEDVFSLARDKDEFSAGERRKIAEDPDYQEKVFSMLPDNQREVALNVITQGEVRPEDLARSYMLGLGTKKEELQAALSRLDAAGNDRLKSEYARKYGEDLTDDFVVKFDGKEERAMLREVRRDPLTGREVLRDTRVDVQSNRSGWGADFTDNFTGTGYMVENSYYQMAGEVELAASRGEELAPERIKELQDDVYTNIELNIEAKEAVANAAADIALTVAAVAVPGGLSLRALMLVGAGGGAAKLLIKQAIMGENYDPSQAEKDMLTGFIDASIGNLGPAHLARALRLGEKAGTVVAERALAKAVTESGERLVKEGAEEALERGTQKLIQDSIVDGSYKVSDESIEALARSVAREGASEAEITAVRQSIKESLQEGLEAEVRNGFKKALTQPALEIAGGAAGAASSGFAGGLLEWDPQKGFAENMSAVFEKTVISGAFGAGGAAAFTGVFKAGGAAYRALKAPDMPASRLGVDTHIVVGGDGDFALVRPVDAPALDGPGLKVSACDLEDDFSRVGNSDYYAGRDGKFYRMRQGADGVSELVPDRHVMPAIKDDAVLHSPELGYIAMPMEERLALLERIKGNSMMQPESIDGFIDNVARTTAKWDDISNVPAQLEAVSKEHGVRFDRYADAVADLKPPVSDADFDSLPAMRKRLAGDPEKLKAMEDYFETKREKMRLERVIEYRTQEIQQVMDRLAREQNLPPVQVLLDDLDPSVGGHYLDGKIVLNKADVLSNSNPANMADTLFHEFVHNQQDALVVSHLADEIGIGAAATPEQLQKLQSQYRDRTGMELSDENAERVLAARAGRPLDAGQAQRAADLAESFSKQKAPGPEFHQAVADMALVQHELIDSVSSPEAARDLLGRLADDSTGELTARLFGDAPPMKLFDLVDAVNASGGIGNLTWLPEYTQLLQEGLQKRADEIAALQQSAYKEYLGGLHEREALLIGRQARAAAEERGLGDAVVVSASAGTRAPGRDSVTPGALQSVEAPAPVARADLAGEADISAPLPADRLYKFGDGEYRLMKRPGEGHWFWGGSGGAADAPVKVHVTVDSAADLGAVQKVLIPALNDDPVLSLHVADWKTFDPMVGAGKAGDDARVPSGRGNDGKGFTIYLRDPADAEVVQKRLDELLSTNGLGRAEPIDTGNVDKIYGSSNRVGVVRDAWPMVQREDGAAAYLLDAEVKLKAHSQFGVGAGDRLDGGQLRQIESETGIKPGSLGYDAHGNLVLKSANRTTVPDDQGRGVYVSETGAGNTPGQLSERPALYALSDRYGLDPARSYSVSDAPPKARGGPVAEGFSHAEMLSARLADAGRADKTPIGSLSEAEVSIAGVRVDLSSGKLDFGRAHALDDQGSAIGDLRVSRDHGSLRWDERERTFYLKDKSTHGTYVKREGESEFVLVKAGEVRVGPNDEIRLGSQDGPELRLYRLKPEQSAIPESVLIDRQVFFNGRRVDLADGEVSIGRNDLISGGGKDDAVNRLVSRDHGRLSYDAATGSLMYEDRSVNGTFIKRAGSDNFERLEKGQKVAIGPNDEVRLGSEYGPQLKHSVERGHVAADGSVLFKRPEGDIYREADGSQVIYDRGGVLRFEDAQGRITSVVEPSGVRRYYEYGPDGSITRADLGPGGVIESRDGRTWVHTEAGGNKTIYQGKMEVLPDGSLKFSDGKSPDVIRRVDGVREIVHPNGRIEYRDADLAVERARLATFSDAYFHHPEQAARFKRMMSDFEARADAAGLPEAEKALTYHHINRLIAAGADAPVPQSERLRLAEQVLGQSAYPHAIDQGFNSTCNVTTVENRIFTRQPAEAARLITDVATTGRYVTADGATIDLSRVPGAIRPDAEASMSLTRPFDPHYGQDIKVDGRRTWASQIFETAAVNVKWARSSQYGLKPGEVIMYEKSVGPVPGSPHDTGERLYKYSVDTNGVLVRQQLAEQPNIWDYELPDIHNQITGGKDNYFVIRGDGYDNSRIKPGEAFVVGSAQDLQNVLVWMDQQKQFPAVLMVDVNHEPFRQFLGAADAGGNGGLHVVNVQGIRRDAATGKYFVEVTNQWGAGSNHLGARAIPLDMLYNATRPYVRPVRQRVARAN